MNKYLQNTAPQLVVLDVVGLPVQLHVSLNGDVRCLLVGDKERLEDWASVRLVVEGPDGDAQQDEAPTPALLISIFLRGSAVVETAP